MAIGVKRRCSASIKLVNDFEIYSSSSQFHHWLSKECMYIYILVDAGCSNHRLSGLKPTEMYFSQLQRLGSPRHQGAHRFSVW